jgi:preprotein translocase subunit SecD
MGIVTVFSLLISGVLTYACVVLLGQVIDFTLSLAGIAGFIVAVGITADSFVVYFERLRDEVREGRTLRSGAERAWVRARRTIISADTVSLLAAAILYWLSVGNVRGFAFTLGLSTITDLFVVFFFTKPLITVLAKTKLYGSGGKFSGLGRQRVLGNSSNPAGTGRPAPKEA